MTKNIKLLSKFSPVIDKDRLCERRSCAATIKKLARSAISMNTTPQSMRNCSCREKKEEAEKKNFDESLKAATKIQAIHRGNQARSAYYEKHDKHHRSSVDNHDGHKGQTSPSKKTMSADSAATSIQATFRGNRDRKSSITSN